MYLPTYTSEVVALRNEDILCVSIPIYLMNRMISNLVFYPIEIKESNIRSELSLTKTGLHKIGKIKK